MKVAVAVVAIVCAFVPAVAFATTTPDPETLRSAIAPAPSADYVEADSTVKGEGPLDASAYAAFGTTDTSKQQAVVNGLKSHHFVAGYGRIWVKKAASVVLVEQILAFAAGSDALSYEGSSKLADTTSPAYTGSIDSSSIPNSYGAEELTGGYHAVAVVFVKGNDLFAVAFVSSGDYMEADVLTQAQAQYSSAPDYTIQPASAPVIDTGSAAYQAGRIAGGAILGLLVIGLVLLAVGVVLRSRRRRAVTAPLPFNLSADGRFWWDGATWQDAGAMAPPSAQRSPDGAFWWDGKSWRPVPRPVEAPR